MLQPKTYNLKPLLLILALPLLAGFGCSGASKEVKQATKPITLNYWRVADGSDTFQDIIQNYRVLHPNVTINYRQLRYEEYEYELLNALAEDRGPDVFSLPNTWLGKYESKLYPLPSTLTIPVTITAGTFKKETQTVLQTKPGLTAQDVRQRFVDTVAKDVVRGGKVMALPLSVDTLVMYLNRDLLNQAGIADAPRDWNAVVDAVKKLTIADKAGKIVQAGAALGRSNTVERAVDIVSLLMMQNGAQMASADGKQATFQLPDRTSNSNPGLQALQFYTDFANPAKEIYTWSADLPPALEAFLQGRVALYFGYAYHLPIIVGRSPKLNLAVSPMPQVAGAARAVNYADYWTEAVSQKTKYADQAWDFVQYATSAEQVKSYLRKAKKPTALRSLLAEQKQDFDLQVFADQVLTASSWYRGDDGPAMNVAFQEMIQQMNKGESLPMDILNAAAQKVQRTL